MRANFRSILNCPAEWVEKLDTDYLCLPKNTESGTDAAGGEVEMLWIRDPSVDRIGGGYGQASASLPFSCFE